MLSGLTSLSLASSSLRVFNSVPASPDRMAVFTLETACLTVGTEQHRKRHHYIAWGGLQQKSTLVLIKRHSFVAAEVLLF